MDPKLRLSEKSPDPVVTVEAALARIDELDAGIGAFVEVLADRARTDAAALARDGRGLLHGVPVAVKELFDVRSAMSAYGSLVCAGRRADADATVVERLHAAGAVVVGLTRSHEFGWGITTQHERRGSTRNPLDPGRVPGGSSGGSAAAVASGMVPLAIGTDTGGSIRIPAAFCGVLGLKTTMGRIPRHGSIPLAPSFDTPGLLARSVDLLRRGLLALAGPHADDPASLDPGPDVWLRHGEGFSFALPDDLQPRPLVACRRRALERAEAALAEIGGRCVDVSVPGVDRANEVFVPQLMAEAHHVHTRLLGTWPSEEASYGHDVAARLRASGSVTVGEYLTAKADTDTIRTSFSRAFATADVLVNVVGASGPSTIDDPDHVTVDGDRMSLLRATMSSTVPQNLAGLPSLTVPIGVDDDGLPIGVQLSGPRWSESLLLEIGGRLEAAGTVSVGR